MTPPWPDPARKLEIAAHRLGRETPAERLARWRDGLAMAALLLVGAAVLLALLALIGHMST